MYSVELACGRAAAVFLARMRRGVRSLATIAGTAPLVGIFGTALGIANSFRGLSGDQISIMVGFADELSRALVFSALGLAVAIPAWCCYRYLVARLKKFEIEMEAATLALVNQLALHSRRPAS